MKTKNPTLKSSFLTGALLCFAGMAQAFAPGDRIQVTAAAEVRVLPSAAASAPSGAANLQGTQAVGSLGSIVGGPKTADGSTWWNIDFDNGKDGWSIESRIQATTPDTAPPNVPKDLAATAVASNQVNLKWSRSVDNVVAGVVRHEVFRNGVLIATTASTNYQDLGLSPNTAYSYSLRAFDAAGNRSGTSAPISATTPAATSADPLSSIPPGTWYQVPDSKVGDIEFNWPASVFPGSGPPRYLTESSGSYDPVHQRFHVFGGGHNDYAGNEIYTFDLKTLRWRREMDPWLITDPQSAVETSGYYPDADGNVLTSQPRSRHSYDMVQYVPTMDRFCAFGGASLYPGSSIAPRTDCFNFGTKQWEQKADVPTAGVGYVAMTAYDPVSGHPFYFRGGGSLSEYDPAANTWTKRSAPDSGGFFNATALIDTKRHRFVAMGVGAFFYYDLNGPANQTQQRVEQLVTGEKDVIQSRRPGFAYDPVNDVYVVWSGEFADIDATPDGRADIAHPPENIYVVNPDTWAIKKITPSPLNSAKPISPSAVSNGLANSTFARFSYIPAKNVFMLVNNWRDQNVFFYKLDPASVSAPAPGFAFSVTDSGPLTVSTGNAVTHTIDTTLVSGTTQPVVFTVGNVPRNATATFDPPSCAPPCSTTLTVQTTRLTYPVPYAMGITATSPSSGINQGTGFILSVKPAQSSADTTSPSVPTGLTASATSSSQINLSWTASTDNVAVAGYKIYRGGVQVATSATTGYSSSGLSAATAYGYTVAAYDAAGNTSALSNTASATTPASTPDTQSPTAPSGLGGNAMSSTEVHLTWTASTDNVGVTGYKVYRNDVPIGTSAQANFIDTGLQANTAYRYTVSAQDAANNSSPRSSAVSVTTPAEAPFDFSLSNDGPRTVSVGQSTSSHIDATLLAGSSQSVSFSVSGLPSGVSASFSPNACQATCTTALTLQTAQGAVPGNYTVQVKATAGSVTHATGLALTVAAGSSPPIPIDRDAGESTGGGCTLNPHGTPDIGLLLLLLTAMAGAWRGRWRGVVEERPDGCHRPAHGTPLRIDTLEPVADRRHGATGPTDR